MEPSPTCYCPECGGERVAAQLSLPTKLMKTEVTPWALWNGSSLAALVCTICGHVTLYARHPDQLSSNQTDQAVSDSYAESNSLP